jgi:hypothetical protein
MQRKRINGAICWGVVAFVLWMGLFDGKEAQANINTLTKSQNLLEGSQIPATKQNGLDNSPMLISQAAVKYDGRWTGVVYYFVDYCGVPLPSALIVDLNVQTSGDRAVIRNNAGPLLPLSYTGKIYSDGIKATAQGNGSSFSWYILDRIGNSATFWVEYQSQTYGCSWYYKGGATLQGP